MLLGIDTSGAVSIAVARTDLMAGTAEVLAVCSDERARHHDEVLLDLIDRALHEAGASRSDLTGVVAGRGPGPFTGLRVGLVAARTIAAVLDIPVYGLCSLEALAAQALESAHKENAGEGPAGAEPGGSSGPTIAVALDARRREVYYARYEAAADGALTCVDGPAVAAPAEVAAQLTASDHLVGSGCELYPDLLPATAPLHHADAGFLLRAAARRLAAGEDLSDTSPLYLREPDAAKPTARKSALGLGPR